MKPYVFNEFYIPSRMMSGIKDYIEHGTPPGTFLSAVICNDLKGACMWADEENLRNLPAYAEYFYNRAPAACWGSEAAMAAWQKARWRPETETPGDDSG